MITRPKYGIFLLAPSTILLFFPELDALRVFQVIATSSVVRVNERFTSMPSTGGKKARARMIAQKRGIFYSGIISGASVHYMQVRGTCSNEDIFSHWKCMANTRRSGQKFRLLHIALSL